MMHCCSVEQFKGAVSLLFSSHIVLQNGTIKKLLLLAVIKKYLHVKHKSNEIAL